MTQDNFTDKDKVKIRKWYYGSDALRRETPCVNRKMHGIEKEYYESGALRMETPLVDGKKHGIARAYYESGALRRVSQYENGKRQGIEKNYDKDKANIEYLVLYKEDWRIASIKSNT